MKNDDINRQELKNSELASESFDDIAQSTDEAWDKLQEDIAPIGSNSLKEDVPPPAVMKAINEKQPVVGKRLGIIVASLFLAFAVAVVVVIVLFAKGDKKVDEQKPDMVKVPSVLGESLEDAQKLLEDKGFRVHVKNGHSDDYEIGDIMGQEPKAGKSIEEGSTVEIIVAVSKDIEITEEPKKDDVASSVTTSAVTEQITPEVTPNVGNEVGLITKAPVESPNATEGAKIEATKAITKEPINAVTKEPTKSITGEPTRDVTKEPTKDITGEPTSAITMEPSNTPAITIVARLDKEDFPDENFRAFIENDYDYDHDGYLSEEECEAVDWININGEYDITDVSGIEYFPNLEELYCSETGISNIDVSKNTNLKTLFCDKTNITSLDVSKNTNLETLWCSDCRINSLDLSKNAKLTELYCSNADLSKLDLSNNPKLAVLDCGGMTLDSLDLSNNKKLSQLTCCNTDINSLDVSQLTELENLNCFNTNIDSLDLRNSPKLQYLCCMGTYIHELDLSKNVNLLQLDCTVTSIESLDISNCVNLCFLYCYETNISYIDFSNNIHLTEVCINEFTECVGLNQNVNVSRY